VHVVCWASPSYCQSWCIKYVKFLLQNVRVSMYIHLRSPAYALISVPQGFSFLPSFLKGSFWNLTFEKVTFAVAVWLIEGHTKSVTGGTSEPFREFFRTTLRDN
jgi:hypothetical protein